MTNILKTQNNKIYQIYDLSNILHDIKAFGNEDQRAMINYILDLTLQIFYNEQPVKYEWYKTKG